MGGAYRHESCVRIVHPPDMLRADKMVEILSQVLELFLLLDFLLSSLVLYV